jgi:hypothetical protein
MTETYTVEDNTQVNAIQALLALLLADTLANGSMKLKWEMTPGIIANLTKAGLTVRADTIATDYGRIKQRVLVIDNFKVEIE